MRQIEDIIEKEFSDQADRIQVGTVDAFQGKEFDVVILSTVRSNNDKEIRRWPRCTSGCGKLIHNFCQWIN